MVIVAMRLLTLPDCSLGQFLESSHTGSRLFGPGHVLSSIPGAGGEFAPLLVRQEVEAPGEIPDGQVCYYPQVGGPESITLMNPSGVPGAHRRNGFAGPSRRLPTIHALIGLRPMTTCPELPVQVLLD